MFPSFDAAADRGLRPAPFDVELVDTAATPLAALSNPFTYWLILASPDNAGEVYIGSATSQTFPLAAGSSVDGRWFGYDPSHVYIRGAAGYVVHVGGCR